MSAVFCNDLRQSQPARCLLACAIRNTVLTILIATAYLPVSAFAQTPAAEADQVNVDIAAGTLADALNTFARSSGIALSYSPEQVAGLHSPGLRGSYSANAGLAALLAGSGLTARDEGHGKAFTLEKLGTATDTPIVTAPLSVSSKPLEGTAEGTYTMPEAVSVIDSDQLQTRYAGDVQTALRSTPGVFTRQSSNQPGIEVNIRGMSGYGRVNSMIDGVPQTFKNISGHESSGGSMLYVHPDFLAGVTVTRGAVSGAHGAGTLAGAANFRTMNVDEVLAEGSDIGLFTRAKFGDNGAHKSVAMIYGQRFDGLWGGEGKIDVLAGYAHTGTGAYRAGDDTKISNTYASNNDPRGALLKLNVDANESHHFNLGVRTYENLFSNSSYIWLIKNKTWTTGYDYSPGSNWVNLDLDLHYNNNTLEYVNNSGSYAGRRTEDISYGLALTNRTQWHLFDEHEGKLDYGVSWARNDFRTHERRGGNHPGELDKASVYSDGEIAFGRFSLLGGLRYEYWRLHGWRAPYSAGQGDCPAGGESCGDEWVSRDGGRLLPRLGGSYQLSDGLQVYATYAHTYRPPTSHEAFFALIPLANNKGSGVVNNLDLDPETRKGWDFGVNYIRDGIFMAGDSLQLKMGYFRYNIDNYIVNDFVYVEGRGESAMWVNRDGNTQMHGVELEGSYDTGKFYLNLAYSDSNTDDQPLGEGAGAGNGEGSIQPTRVATLDVGTRLFNRKLTLGLQGRYVGQGKEARYDWSAGGNYWETTDSYTLLDLYGSLDVSKGLQLFFSIENLQDRRYGYAGSSYSAYSSELGRGRTITVGVTGRFDPSSEGRPFTGDWSGTFVGAQIGRSKSRIRGNSTAADGSTDAIAATESANVDLEDAQAGIYAGYDYKFSNGYMLGGELGMDWIGGSSNQYATSTEIPESTRYAEGSRRQAAIRYDFRWLGTAKLRVGYDFGRFMAYANAGLAWLSEEQSRSQYRTNSSSSSSPYGTNSSVWRVENSDNVRSGWTIGIGGEYALSERWALRAEYSYTKFGRDDIYFDDARAGVGRSYSYSETITDPSTGTTTRVTHNVTGGSEIINGRLARNSIDMRDFKLGLTYRF